MSVSKFNRDPRWRAQMPFCLFGTDPQLSMITHKITYAAIHSERISKYFI